MWLHDHMKAKLFAVAALSGMLVTVAGCYSTVEGHKRAGLPFLKDTIEGRYERPPAQVLSAARKVLEYNGTIRAENASAMALEAKVDTRTVWVRVEEIDPNLTRVQVQARTKTGASDVDLAAEIEKQIALQLK